MYYLFLTQYDGKIIGPIAKLLGYLMNGIFELLDKIGIPNIGLAIIIFTVLIYMALMPLTIKQQKFSKLSAKMNPEIQAIQAKYKGKKDQDSMAKMNDETKAVYAKYGVSPSGSCVQLIIQMPIMIALYRVIYSMPGYVTKVKDAFLPLADKLFELGDKASTYINNKDNFASSIQYSKQFENELFTSGNAEYVKNTFIDILNKATTTEWSNLAQNFPDIKGVILQAGETLDRYNSFLGLNIANSPSYMFKEAFSTKSFGMFIAALSIPLLCLVTQWLNTKLMPQQPAQDGDQSSMAQSMKTMNVMMPLMSAAFSITLPSGMGLYWIAGAVIRCFQQIAINKHIDKIDIDAEIKKNIEKYNKKREKQGLPAQTLNSNARMSTKSINEKNSSSKPRMTQAERDEAMKKATEYYNKGVKPGSLAAKANMVKQYNERNNSKNDN